MRVRIVSASLSVIFWIWICQFPCVSFVCMVSDCTSISAMLKIAVTRNTAKMMQSSVMRLCRRCTFAEIGIRLR